MYTSAENANRTMEVPGPKQKKREREEIEMYRSRNDAPKFFKNVRRLTEGFKPVLHPEGTKEVLW